MFADTILSVMLDIQSLYTNNNLVAFLISEPVPWLKIRQNFIHVGTTLFDMQIYCNTRFNLNNAFNELTIINLSLTTVINAKSCEDGLQNGRI